MMLESTARDMTSAERDALLAVMEGVVIPALRSCRDLVHTFEIIKQDYAHRLHAHDHLDG